MMNDVEGKYIAISGGIGGAKLALGLSHVLADAQLAIIANTGDDFEHFGLYISPDLDTLTYTLADKNDLGLGWGRRDESWNFMDASNEIGLDTWFKLGDKDLALHIYRTERLKNNISLSGITKELLSSFGVLTDVIPMSDFPIRTMIETSTGDLSFQEYFVKFQANPDVQKIRFDGAEDATPAPEFLNRLDDPGLQAVIICPSNPFLSIMPVLSLPGIEDRLRAMPQPVIVVSPVVQGKSLKGPTAKIMQDLNLEPGAPGIAKVYQGLATHFVLDSLDKDLSAGIESLGFDVLTTNIVMNSLEDKISLAREVVEFARGSRT